MSSSFRDPVSIIVFLLPFIFVVCCGTPNSEVTVTVIPKAEETETFAETKANIISKIAVERGLDKCPTVDASVESLIHDELKGTWVADDGSRFKLSTGRMDALERLLIPVIKHQYELSYAGASTRAEEEASGKTLVIIVKDNSLQRTVTWTKKPGDGEKKLQEAGENIGLQSMAINIDGTDLSDEQNLRSGATTRIKNGFLTVSSILRKADWAGQCRAHYQARK